MSTDPTLERLANATLLVPFESDHAPRWLREGLANGLAGVCLFHNNISSLSQVTELNAQLAEAADAPLVALDEEGGDVTRIGQQAGSNYPGNAALGAVDNAELTRTVHRSLGAELRGLGFTLNLAPTVDVNTVADNPTIGTRAFGANAELVARHTHAAVTGLQESGVAGCAKHFPGHGATRQDSHTTLPTVEADRDLLLQRELIPFRSAIDAGVRAILTAHITLPSLGLSSPATLTPELVTELLRKELGFDGAVVSDALDMHGVSGDIGIAQAAVRALGAGCDLLCLGRFVYADQVAGIRSAIVEAVRSGELDGERLEEAAERTTQLRSWTREKPVSSEVDAVGLSGARRATRLDGELPRLYDPLVLQVDTPPLVAAGDVPWGLSPWFPGTEYVDAENTPPEEVLGRAGGRGLIVVVRDAHRHPAAQEFVTRLCQQRPDTVAVEMGLPVWRPDSRAHISTYGAAWVNAQSAAELLTAALS